MAYEVETRLNLMSIFVRKIFRSPLVIGKPKKLMFANS